MKIKYLKKLRKRYSWKWVATAINHGALALDKPGYWRILDHKEKRVREWSSAQNFISSTLGFETSVNYDHRKKDRSRLVEYKKYLNQ